MNQSSQNQVNAAVQMRAASSKQKNQVFTEDEGFMRGARIAEKIQEFYHTTGSSILPSNASSKNQIVFNKTAGNGELPTGPSSNPKSRSNLMSQGGSRASGPSKMLYQSENGMQGSPS